MLNSILFASAIQYFPQLINVKHRARARASTDYSLNLREVRAGSSRERASPRLAIPPPRGYQDVGFAAIRSGWEGGKDGNCGGTTRLKRIRGARRARAAGKSRGRSKHHRNIAAAVAADSCSLARRFLIGRHQRPTSLSRSFFFFSFSLSLPFVTPSFPPCVAVRPLKVEIDKKEQTLLSANRKYDLKCVTFGSRPPAKLSWYLEDKKLINHTEQVRLYPRRSNDTYITRARARVIGIGHRKTDTRHKGRNVS